MDASPVGAILGIPPFVFGDSNTLPLSGGWTVCDGQFDWGGRLLKSNGGVQRYPQNGWKPFVEGIAISRLYCKTYKSSSYESRTK